MGDTAYFVCWSLLPLATLRFLYCSFSWQLSARFLFFVLVLRVCCLPFLPLVWSSCSWRWLFSSLLLCIGSSFRFFSCSSSRRTCLSSPVVVRFLFWYFVGRGSLCPAAMVLLFPVLLSRCPPSARLGFASSSMAPVYFSVLAFIFRGQFFIPWPLVPLMFSYLA